MNEFVVGFDGAVYASNAGVGDVVAEYIQFQISDLTRASKRGLEAREHQFLGSEVVHLYLEPSGPFSSASFSEV